MILDLCYKITIAVFFLFIAIACVDVSVILWLWRVRTVKKSVARRQREKQESKPLWAQDTTEIPTVIEEDDRSYGAPW